MNDVRPIAAFSWLLLSSLCFMAMASGGAFIESELPGELPVGNAIVAVGLSALALASVMLSAKGDWQRRVCSGVFFLSLLWLPVSLLLARNLLLNFGGRNGDIWIVFTLAVLALAFGCWLWALTVWMYRLKTRKN